MSHAPEEYAALIQELALAWEHVEGQFAKNRRIDAKIPEAAEDEMKWAALGYTIHNLYNAMENYLVRVAKFFENRLDDPSWHKDLVDRMALSIEGVRPAVLPRELRRDIHELRSFRQVFRDIYDTELDSKRVEQANQLVGRVVEGFRTAHGLFTRKLEEIRAGL